MTYPTPQEPGSAGQHEGGSVLQLIQKIQSGQIRGREIGAADRRMCVSYLGSEGYSVPEIARVLNVSDRTVQRDRMANREEAALNPDPSLLPITAGRLLEECELTIQRLRRISRDKAAPHAVRVEADRAAFQTINDYTQRLQSLGSLPSAGRHLSADVTIHRAEPPSYDETFKEIERLKQIGATPDSIKLLEDLEQQVTRADMAQRVHEAANVSEVHDDPA